MIEQSPRRSFKTVQQALLIYSVLALCIFASGSADFQYFPVKDLTTNDWFPGPTSSWQARGPIENVIVGTDYIEMDSNRNDVAGVRKTINLPNTHIDKILVQVIISGRTLHHERVINPQDKNALGHPEDVEKPNLIVLQMHDTNGIRLKTAWIGQVSGHAEPFTFYRILSLPANTRQLKLGILLRASNTKFFVESAKVNLVKRRNISIIISVFLVIALITISGFYLYRLVNVVGYKIILLWSCLLSGSLISLIIPVKSLLDSFESLVTKVFSQRITETILMNALSPFAHVFIFVLLSCICFTQCMKASIPCIYPLAFLLLIALATEGLQLHLLNRSASLADIFYNGLGIGIALIFSLLFSSAASRSRSN